MKRAVLALLAWVVLWPAAALSHPERWPERDVRIIVPFQPGDAADADARRLAQHFTQAFGVHFVVDNRPGVSGRMGTEVSIRAEPDGYTLTMSGTGPLILVPELLGANYDAVASFEPVLLTAAMPLLLLTPDAPAFRSVRDLELRSRVWRGGLSACSTGLATPSHIAAILFARTHGIELTHVPHRGAYNAMTDVMAARCDLMFDSAASSGRHVRAGRVRALGITAPEPPPAWDGVPALPGVTLRAWTALIAPEGTPDIIVAQLNEAGRRFLAQPEERARILAEGGVPFDLSPRQVRSFLRAEMEAWRLLLRTHAIRTVLGP